MSDIDQVFIGQLNQIEYNFGHRKTNIFYIFYLKNKKI